MDRRLIEVAPDAASLARLAAEAIARRVVEGARARGEFHLALAGGATPRPTYQRLAADPLRQGLPWDRLHLWFGDERGVPPDHPESNFRMARESLLDLVPVAPGRIHRLRGEEADLPVAAAAYEADLRAALGPAPRLDLVLLGMGDDGHVASLFPGSEALAETRSLVRAVEAPRPPARRLTLTLPALNAARSALVLVSGAAKADRVAEVLAGAAPALPASRLAPEELVWLLDAEAAARSPFRLARRPAPA